MVNPVDRTIMQNAWVVDDVETACLSWVKDIGIGPFFIYEFIDTFTDVHYYGKPGKLDIIVGLAQAGSVQIELIQPVTKKSAYREVIPEGTTGFHHACVWSYDFDADINFFESRGLKTVNSGSLGITKFAYFDTRPVMGCMLEIATKNEEVEAFTKVITDAGKNWDGSNPIRYGEIS